MVNQLLPFPLPIDTAAIAGATLWALALYLGFSPLADWVTVQFNRWLNFAERSLYTSEKEFERTRRARGKPECLSRLADERGSLFGGRRAHLRPSGS